MNDERVVKLQSGGAIKLSVSPNFDLFSLSIQDRVFLGDLIQIMDRYEVSSALPSMPEQSESAKPL